MGSLGAFYRRFAQAGRPRLPYARTRPWPPRVLHYTDPDAQSFDVTVNGTPCVHVLEASEPDGYVRLRLPDGRDVEVHGFVLVSPR